MGAIVDTLVSIGDFFVSLFGFVIGFIEDIISVGRTLGAVVASIPTYLSFFPAEISALILSLIGVVVVYKILGRE